MAATKKIQTREQLATLASTLGVRRDWHEPDEQDVTVQTCGEHFDNAGFWGSGNQASVVERYVVVYQGGVPVAEVNLATLFAFACGYGG